MTDRPRIGIDGYNLALPNGTGIAVYGFNLARTLQAAGHPIDGVFGVDAGRDPAMREVLFFDRTARDRSPPPEAQRLREVRRRNRIALNPWLRAFALEVPNTGRVERAELADRMPAFDRIVTSPNLFQYAHRHFANYGRFVPLRMVNPPAIMHWTYPVPVELVGARNVYTIHDLIPLKMPFTSLEAKTGYRRLLAGCIARASQICTVSESSSADIVSEFGIDPRRITTTFQSSPPPEGWEAVDPDGDAAVLQGTFGLAPRGYFLFMGAIEPKKNIGRLLEAFLSLDTTTPLVLASGRSWQSESALALLPKDEAAETERGKRIADRVIRVDHMSRQLLFRLIRNAKAVLFPSLYEGFGLPILEALQLGTPVLAGRTSSMPEVGGEAALYVDPYDTQAIAAAIRALDRDEALTAGLAAAGPSQAAKFGEDRYRERLEQLYAITLSRSV